MQIGDKRLFSEPQKGEYILKEIVKQNLALEWKWIKTICPHCQKEISETRVHNIQEVHIWERIDGKDTIMLAPTTDGLYMRLPDKNYESSRDMTDKVKSEYLKNKE